MAHVRANAALVRPLCIVCLRATTLELLQRPIRGRCAFQSLLRRIQQQIQQGELVCEEEELNTLVRMASGGGITKLGGFQRRVVALLTDVVASNPQRSEPSGQLALPLTPPYPDVPLRVIRGGRP